MSVTIFRISVSGYETYSPEDFVHPSKTSEQFNQDVRDLLARFPVEESELYEYEGKQGRGFITGNTLQEYLEKELLKLGYAKTDIHEIDLGGECLYDANEELPDLMPISVKDRIVRRAKLVREQMDNDMEEDRKKRQ